MTTCVRVFINIFFIFSLLVGCDSLPKAPPSREFSTEDLLLYPRLLSNGWIIIADPTTETRSDSMGLRNTLSGSSIELQTSNSSVDHMVVVFPSARDAAKSYKDHDYTRNTSGLNPKTWESLPGYKYTSPMANQYRVVCEKGENPAKVGKQCVIEAQYDEFHSILIYYTTNSNQVIDELGLLSRAIDTTMALHLAK